MAFIRSPELLQGGRGAGQERAVGVDAQHRQVVSEAREHLVRDEVIAVLARLSGRGTGCYLAGERAAGLLARLACPLRLTPLYVSALRLQPVFRALRLAV